MPHNIRRKVIEKYDLESHADPALTTLLKSIATLFDIPIALVTIARGQELHLHARLGIEAVSVPVEGAFCTDVINEERLIVIDDLEQHERFKDFDVVKQDQLRFYAGCPLRMDNVVIGTVCIMDTKPRTLTEEQQQALSQLSDFVSSHLTLVNEHYNLEAEHSLLDSSPAVLIRWRFRSGIELQSITRNVEDVLHLNYEKLMSKELHFELSLTPESQDEFNFMLQSHLSGVQTTECNLEIALPHRKIWVRLLSKAFYSDTGKLHSIQAIATDNTEHRYIEHRLNEANKQMRLLLEASELGTWDYDVLTDTTKVNHRWCDIIGVDYEFYDGSTRFWQQRIHPADVTQVKALIEAHMKGETSIYSASYRMRHENGDWIWIETYGRIVERDENNAPLRLAGTHRDITERKIAEINQTKQAQLLGFINKARAAYLDNNDLSGACQQILPELIDIADSQFAFIGQVVIEDDRRRLFIHAISELSWNAASEALVDLYKGRKLYFDSFDNLFGSVITTGKNVISNQPTNHSAARGTPTGHPPIYRFMGLPIEVQGELVGMIGLANKFGHYTEEDAKFLKPLLDALGGLFYAIELEKARSAAEDMLQRMAMTDALSGLNNRRSFYDYAANLQNAPDTYYAMIDIDHFKKVNDTYGHDAGDDVIRHLSQVLKDQLSQDCFIARMGGEEFCIIFENQGPDQVHQQLENLRQTIEQDAIETNGHNLTVSISIGVAELAQKSSDSTLIDADKALYQAKQQGRNQIIWSDT